MRCLTQYTSSAEYVLSDLRYATPAEAASLGVQARYAARLLVSESPTAERVELDWRDVAAVGDPSDDQDRGYVLGANSVCYEIDATYEARLLAARDARLAAEQHEHAIAGTVVAPLVGSAGDPCPLCGTWCCGDCSAEGR